MSPSMMPTRPPHFAERDREVHGDRRLADAAFAAPTAITFFTPGQRLA